MSVAPGVDLEPLADAATYVGSGEHKSYPSSAGPARLRSDASKCDPSLHGNFDQLTEWLRDGIRRGHVAGPWYEDFPQYVWVQRDGRWYEARIVNRTQGTYKGYELEPAEAPELP